MSFILDALRKSDAERQRAATPGLADARYATRRSRRNIWLPILVVVLSANVVFMGVQWVGRSGERPVTSESSASTPPNFSQPAVPAEEPTEEPPRTADIRPLAREAELGEPLLELSGDIEIEPLPVTTEGPEPISSVQSSEMEPAPISPPVASTAPPSTSTSRIVKGNELPTAEQLVGSGALNIPLLNLDLHVYSEKPAARFVVINARKYKEGGQLSEGPTVESITEDGVVLANQGQRFTLSRK